MKDIGGSVHSLDIVKKKSSSGCLIIKRKIPITPTDASGVGGVNKGFSDSRNLFTSVKDKKRPRFIRTHDDDSESSDEFMTNANGDPYASKRDGCYDRSSLALNSRWQDGGGDRMVVSGSGSGSGNGRRVYEEKQREFGYDGRNMSLDERSYRGSSNGNGNGMRYMVEDDGMRLSRSVPRDRYQDVSEAPIRLQGKNGVLKVMVKKHKPMISVPYQSYDLAQAEERKESRMGYYGKKQLNVSHTRYDHTRYDHREVVNRSKQVMGSSMYLGSKKHVLPKSQEISDSDVSLPVRPSGVSVLHSSNEKPVKSEKKICQKTEKVTPEKGKETKVVKRGSGTEKQLLREKIRSMLLSSGWTIDYRPRRNRDYLDSVYISPSGTAYWSIIKAYEALQKEGNDHSQVGSEFTPLPVETLNKLTRQTRKKIEREMKKQRKDEGKSLETSKRRLTEASQDSGDDSNENDYMETDKERNVGISSHTVQGRRSNKLGRCLLIRSEGKKCENGVFVPYSGKRTLLSWLIDSGTVQVSEKVQYMNCNKTSVMQEGWITKEGIHCGCCSKILPVLKFELHAGSKLRQPFLNIFVQSGKSLTQCLIDAWNKQGELEKKGFHVVDMDGDDSNDDTCGLCADGGDLICCDGCPSTFHQSCLGIKMLPQGDWHCPNCSCKYCGMATEADVKTDSTLLVCSLCEKKYHESCILEIDENTIGPPDLNLSFCGQTCLQLYNNLQKFIGVKHELDSGFSWGLIRRSDVSSPPETCSSTEMSQRVECNSKLAVALSVIDECFVPIIDRRSGINLIHNVLYNCGSNFSRINYSGFYTAVLERADEIICAASIRIHGTQLAEMPYIGTRHIYRRQGMCRRLLSAIESALASLHIEKLIIPAIAEHMHTWTDVFGFGPLKESHKQEMRSMNMLVFPGTDMLQKPLNINTNTEIKISEPISPDDKELSGNIAHTDSDLQDPPIVSLDDSTCIVKEDTQLPVLPKNVHFDSMEAKKDAQDTKVIIEKTADSESKVDGFAVKICNSIPPEEPNFVLQDNADNALLSKVPETLDAKSDDVKVIIDTTADSESKVDGFAAQVSNSLPPEDPEFVLQDNALLSEVPDPLDAKSDSHIEEIVSNDPGSLAGTESVSASTDSDSVIRVIGVPKGQSGDNISS